MWLHRKLKYHRRRYLPFTKNPEGSQTFLFYGNVLVLRNAVVRYFWPPPPLRNAKPFKCLLHCKVLSLGQIHPPPLNALRNTRAFPYACKHIGICTVLRYEGGGGVKNLEKLRTYYVDVPLGSVHKIRTLLGGGGGLGQRFVTNLCKI